MRGLNEHMRFRTIFLYIFSSILLSDCDAEPYISVVFPLTAKIRPTLATAAKTFSHGQGVYKSARIEIFGRQIGQMATLSAILDHICGSLDHLRPSANPYVTNFGFNELLVVVDHICGSHKEGLQACGDCVTNVRYNELLLVIVVVVCISIELHFIQTCLYRNSLYIGYHDLSTCFAQQYISNIIITPNEG